MLVVTLPPSARHDPATFARRAMEAGADILEIRGDLTPDVAERPLEDLPLLLSPRGTLPPLLTSLRSGDFADLATDLPEQIQENALPPGVTLIRSFHDHDGTPSLPELRDRAERMMEGGDTPILKFACTIRSFADLRTLEELHALLPAHRERVILGMGPKAHFARALSPLRNVLTYTYLSDGDEAASGQLPIAFYKSVAHCRKPKIYGILGGAQILRSLSPTIHNTLFRLRGIDALYSVFPVDDGEDFGKEIRNLEALGVAGLSVTAPWKQEAFAMAGKRDPLAERLGSANTLVRANGGWKAFNTDCAGFERGYPFLEDTRDVAIVGSGGVVPAVIEACKRRAIPAITVYARNAGARKELEGRFGIAAAPIEALKKATPDAVICAIGDDVPVPLPPTKQGAHAVDLRYGRPTAFLSAAGSLGYAVHDGRAMLLHQALEQFRLFTGKKPSAEDERAVQSLL